LALYADMADMVRLGAYKRGADPATDEAIRVYPRLNDLLTQSRDDPTALDECFTGLAAALAPERA
jgi:flagellum-specific ATP synthase